MTMANRTSVTEATQAVLLDDPDFSREIVERTVQAILDEEMTAHLGAERYEHSGERRGYHNGTKPRMLMTRVGTLGLVVPQDRDGTFSTEVFARYQSQRAGAGRQSDGDVRPGDLDLHGSGDH